MSVFCCSADEELAQRIHRRLSESDAATISTVSTDATASNLVGPGRTLGLALRHLGQKLETTLNKTFEKRGFGPIATSERIIRRAKKLRRSGDEDKDINNVIAKIKRTLHNYLLEEDCRRLVKYLQSDVLSNQLLAIDGVVDISLRDAYARDILNEFKVAPILARVSLMAEREVGAGHLVSRSRKALICVEDNYVNAVMRKLQLVVMNDTLTGIFYVGIPKSFIHPSKYSDPLLEYLLQDGKLSFAVLRFFHELLSGIGTPEHPAGSNSSMELVWNIHGWLYRFLLSLKDNIDWPSLDKFLHFLVEEIYEEACGDEITLRYSDYQAFDFILGKADSLPQTVEYLRSRMTASCSPPFPEFAVKAREICSVVEELSGVPSKDISEKTDLRKLLNKFPFLVDEWTYMHGAYFPLCMLFESAGQNLHDYDSLPFGPRGRFLALAREIAKHQAANWDDSVQKHVEVVAGYNKYCRVALYNAFEEAFPSLDFDRSLGSSAIRSLAELWEGNNDYYEWNCIEIEKHCNEDGSFVHFCQPAHITTRFCGMDVGTICYKARIPRSHVIGLKMKAGEKFDSTGYYPLYAHTSTEGKVQYITELEYPHYLYYGTIEDGACETEYWDEKGVHRKSNGARFQILTSRWEADPSETDIDSLLTWELSDKSISAGTDLIEGAHLDEVEDE